MSHSQKAASPLMASFYSFSYEFTIIILRKLLFYNNVKRATDQNETFSAEEAMDAVILPLPLLTDKCDKSIGDSELLK